jgi:hypothetical protein
LLYVLAMDKIISGVWMKSPLDMIPPHAGVREEIKAKNVFYLSKRDTNDSGKKRIYEGYT